MFPNDDQYRQFRETVSYLQKKMAIRPGERVLNYLIDPDGETLARLCGYAAKANQITDLAMADVPAKPTRDYVLSVPNAGIYTFGEPKSLFLTTNAHELYGAALIVMGRPLIQTVVSSTIA